MFSKSKAEKKTVTINAHRKALTYICLLPNTLFTASNDGTVKEWDSNTNKLKKEYQAGKGVFVKCIDVKNDILVSAGMDSHIRFWDTRTSGSIEVQTIQYSSQINSVAFDKSSDLQIVSGGADGKVCLWDRRKTSDASRSYQIGGTLDSVSITSVAVTISRTILSASDKGKIHFLVLDGDKEKERSFSAHNKLIKRIDLNTNEDMLLSCSADHSLRVWVFNEQGDQLEVASFADHENSVYDAAFVPPKTSENSFVGSASGSLMRLWSLPKKNQVSKYTYPTKVPFFKNKENPTVNCIRFCSPKCMVSGWNDGSLVFHQIGRSVFENLPEQENGTKEYSRLKVDIFAHQQKQKASHSSESNPKPPSCPDRHLDFLPSMGNLNVINETFALEDSKKIGTGSFGEVYRCQWRTREVAVKKLNSANLANEENFLEESRVMAKAASPFIVYLYGVCIKTQPYMIVMELAHQGALSSWLHDTAQEITWPQRFKVALDIASGMHHLHSLNILHRDLKSDNVLLYAKGDTPQAKLADFGLAKVKREVSIKNTLRVAGKAGTLAWMAPEVFTMKECTSHSDVYSVGMTFWELASRKYPYKNHEIPELIPTDVSRGEQETIPEETPPAFGRLIAHCWNAEPSKRPSMGEVVNAVKPLLMRKQRGAVDSFF